MSSTPKPDPKKCVEDLEPAAALDAVGPPGLGDPDDPGSLEDSTDPEDSGLLLDLGTEPEANSES